MGRETRVADIHVTIRRHNGGVTSSPLLRASRRFLTLIGVLGLAAACATGASRPGGGGDASARRSSGPGSRAVPPSGPDADAEGEPHPFPWDVDETAAEANPTDPHPLAMVLLRRRAANARRAIVALERLRSVQGEYHRGAVSDRDGDGVGEFGHLAELVDVGGTEALGADPAATPDFGPLRAGGYVYRVYLPDDAGRGVSHRFVGPSRSDPQRSESAWVCYAWPERYGVTGELTFVVNQDGDVLASDSAGYSGTDGAPAPGAAYFDGGLRSITGTLALGNRGQDGRMWRLARQMPSPGGPLRIPPSDSALRDRARLTELFDAACGDVATACGRPWNERPRLAVTSAASLADIVGAELSALAGITPTRAELAQLAVLVKAGMVAKYDHSTHTVHVVPRTAELMAELREAPWILSDVNLRLVLLHEVTHALDFQDYPLAQERASRRGADELVAWGAVVEGHAQFVTETIARAEGRQEAFERFSSEQIGNARGARASADPPTTVGLPFPYAIGLAFFRAISQGDAAADPAAAVDRALRTPPRSVSDVRDPAAWLERTGRLERTERDR